ncbi:MAG: hypothetical protein QW413_04010, partial [Nitrososphaerota archaeon]
MAELFNKLEQKARLIGGASEKEKIEQLKPIIYEIDYALAKILGISEEIVKRIEEQVELLIERRIAGSKETKPESVKGEKEVKLKPHLKKAKAKKEAFKQKKLLEYYTS